MVTIKSLYGVRLEIHESLEMVIAIFSKSKQWVSHYPVPEEKVAELQKLLGEWFNNYRIQEIETTILEFFGCQIGSEDISMQVA